jgi:Zn-finger nucleic acid-binding protein
MLSFRSPPAGLSIERFLETASGEQASDAGAILKRPWPARSSLRLRLRLMYPRACDYCPRSKGVSMGRLNLERLMTFADGSYLAISTEYSKQGEFSCTVYSALETDDRTAFRVISNHLLSAPTCLSAQEHAYSWALRLYPRAAETMKKPPYLIWHGPQSQRSN